MFGWLPLAVSLLRFRARASVALLCVWATLLIANLASAEVGVQTKTRVWDFESAAPLNVCSKSIASAGQHREIRSCSAGFASGCSLAAVGAERGGTRAAAGAARNNPEQSALIDMAKGDRRAGITPGDAQAYKELGKEAGVRSAARRFIRLGRTGKSRPSMSDQSIIFLSSRRNGDAVGVGRDRRTQRRTAAPPDQRFGAALLKRNDGPA